MKIIESSTFNAAFPEQYDWHLIDSISFSALGAELSALIRIELTTQKIDQRLCVPGLRQALVRIAHRAEHPRTEAEGFTVVDAGRMMDQRRKKN